MVADQARPGIRCSTSQASVIGRIRTDGRKPGRASAAHSRGGSGTAAPARLCASVSSIAAISARREPAARLRRGLALDRRGRSPAARAAPKRAGSRSQRVASALGVAASVSSDGVAEASTIGAFSILRAHHGQVARVVDDALLLLVGAVVLLVDDDQAEIRRTAGTAPSARRRRPARSAARDVASRRAARWRSVRPECHSAGRRRSARRSGRVTACGQRDLRQQHQHLARWSSASASAMASK